MDFQTALQVCMASVKSRQRNVHKDTYHMYYANTPNEYLGKITAHTLKELRKEITAPDVTYKYAVVFKNNDHKPYLFYNREVKRNGFFSMQQKRKPMKKRANTKNNT